MTQSRSDEMNAVAPNEIHRTSTILSCILVLVLCAIGSINCLAANAGPLLDATPNFDARNEAQTIIRDIAIFGNADTRQTEEEYAASHGMPLDQLTSKVAATGSLDCADQHGGANLTEALNVITAPAHSLNDADTCKPLAKTSQCIFTVKVAGHDQKYPVKELADTGFHCPTPTTPDEDWAVMILKTAVKGITPYRLSAYPNSAIYDGQSVISVAALELDFVRTDPVTRKKVLPRSIGDCQIHKVYFNSVQNHVPVYFSADCSMSFGASGGAILGKDLSQRTLLGVDSRFSANEEKEKEAYRTGVPNKKPFDERNWAGYYVPIAGSFLAAIRKAETAPQHDQ